VSFFPKTPPDPFDSQDGLKEVYPFPLMIGPQIPLPVLLENFRETGIQALVPFHRSPEAPPSGFFPPSSLFQCSRMFSNFWPLTDLCSAGWGRAPFEFFLARACGGGLPPNPPVFISVVGGTS